MQTLTLQRMRKHLKKSLWSPCYRVSNWEIKELHGPLALEKLNNCVEKKMLTSDPGMDSTFLKRNLREIRLKNRLDFDVKYFCSLSRNNFFEHPLCAWHHSSTVGNTKVDKTDYLLLCLEEQKITLLSSPFMIYLWNQLKIRHPSSGSRNSSFIIYEAGWRTQTNGLAHGRP